MWSDLQFLMHLKLLLRDPGKKVYLLGNVLWCDDVHCKSGLNYFNSHSSFKAVLDSGDKLLLFYIMKITWLRKNFKLNLYMLQPYQLAKEDFKQFLKGCQNINLKSLRGVFATLTT